MAEGKRGSGDLDQFTQQAVEVVRECARVPSLSSARVVDVGGGRYEVVATWSQRDLERGRKLTFSRSYFVEREGERVAVVTSSSSLTDTTRELKVSHAPSSGLRAVLVKDRPANAVATADPQQYIEVWSRERLVKTVAVADLKKHGKIHEDIHFGSFLLSASGRKLLYIAERKKPKAVSFFKKSADKPEEEGAITVQGAEFVFESSWGEQLSTVVDPVPVVMSVGSEECRVLEVGEVGDVSAGQAQWVPSVSVGEENGEREEEEVVFVGWENKPRKLGFIYCLNRPSALYHAHLPSGKITRLTSNTHYVYSPRFSPQGDKLVFFEAVAGGPHHSCAALKMMDWASKTVSVVVDVVSQPEVGSFPGFYSVFLPERCWDREGKKIVASETWGSLLKVVLVDVESGSVRCVSGDGEEKGAWSVACVSHDLVVAQHASCSQTPRLVVGVVPSDPSSGISWTELSPSPSSSITDGLSWEVLSFQPDPNTSHYEAILLHPKPRPSPSPLPPLAVYPHGGPHVVAVADFMAWPVCLAALGFAVLLVNYRGSTGFGQDAVLHLPGKVGRSDVDDVQHVAEWVVRRGGVDGERVVVLGGSHGGFISLHLVGQYPDFYKAASVRNPVVDLAAKRVSSDIPDWSFYEGGLTFDPAKPPTEDDVSKLLTRSPIVHVEKIKAPILILLGADDLRVPPSQGKYLYHTLRAMGKETKLHVYPGENHPVSSVFPDADAFMNTALWLHRHGCTTAQST